MTGKRALCVEADTIVGDFKGHPFRIGFYLYLYVASSGVFYDVTAAVTIVDPVTGIHSV